MERRGSSACAVAQPGDLCFILLNEPQLQAWIAISITQMFYTEVYAHLNFSNRFRGFQPTTLSASERGTVRIKNFQATSHTSATSAGSK